MNLTHTTLTIDIEMRNKAKRLGLNLSETFREALESKINILERDVEGINIELVKSKINGISKDIQQKNEELAIYLKEKAAYEEIINKKKVELLIKEKEEIEKTEKCYNCGNYIKEKGKIYKFPAGVICSVCYMTMSSKQYRQWSKKK